MVGLFYQPEREDYDVHFRMAHLKTDTHDLTEG